MDALRLSEPAHIIAQVDSVLNSQLTGQAELLGTYSPVAAELVTPLIDFCSGGKRIRALAAWWGYELTGGTSPQIAHIAASVELLHAAALIHDDIIDKSATRRGQPSTHAVFTDLHRRQGLSGSSEEFGASAAIVAGDLCLGLSESLFTTSALDVTQPPVVHAHDALRRDVMFGQYLDIRMQAATFPVKYSASAEVVAGYREIGTFVVDRAMEVLTYKSAKYSVEQPFALGAAIGGAGDAFLRALAAFTLPLGQAFQLKDDELGVFGNPSTTGKPAGDDLRSGKKTVLVGLALQRLAPTEARWLLDHLGAVTTEDDLATMVSLLETSGAHAAHTDLMEAKLSESFAALDELRAFGLDDAAMGTLRAYAERLTRRNT